MDISKLMKQAQQMQSAAQEMQTTPTEGTAGNGKVTVKGTAGGEIHEIKIDPSIVDPSIVDSSDVDFLEGLVLAAVQDCIGNGKKILADEAKKMTGGLGLPKGLF